MGPCLPLIIADWDQCAASTLLVISGYSGLIRGSQASGNQRIHFMCVLF